jgi:hypothetical protein
MAQEAALKAVRSKNRQDVKLVGFPTNVKFYSESELSRFCYFRIPVTQAIPVQRGVGAPPDDGWRQSNKVFLKGVGVRMKISFSVSVAVMGVCYRAKVQSDDKIPLDGPKGRPASSFLFGREAKPVGARLLSLEETNFLSSKDGPFSVIPGPDGRPMLDSPDQSLFTSRLTKGAGAPVGTARWKSEKDGKEKKAKTFREEFHVASLMRTPDTGKLGGYVQTDARIVEVFFDVNQEVEFVDGASTKPVFEPQIELMFGVKPITTVTLGRGSVGIDAVKEFAPLEGGDVSGVMTAIYYSSL